MKQRIFIAGKRYSSTIPVKPELEHPEATYINTRHTLRLHADNDLGVTKPKDPSPAGQIC